MQHKHRHCMFILGMHRSGTSALAGVLHHLGVELGKDLMPPGKDDNPKGFFENNKVYSINETLLEHLNSTWDSPFLLPNEWWTQEELFRYKQDILDVVEEEFSDNQLMSSRPVSSSEQVRWHASDFH